jgi:hypothetical protein
VALVVRGLVVRDRAGLGPVDLVARVALVVRDRAGLGPVALVARVDLDPVDPVDMRGRVGPHLEDLAVRHRRDPVDMRGPVGPHLEDLAVRHRRDPVDMRGQVDLEDLAVRHRRDPVDLVARADLDPVDMRGRVGLGVRDRQDRVDLAARADLDLVDPVDLAGRVDTDPLDHRRRHTGLGVSTDRVVPRWAAPTMRRTASVHPTTVRRLRRRNADSAGMAGLLPEGRRLTGSGRRPRVAGTDLRLPVVGTADGMGRRVI